MDELAKILIDCDDLKNPLSAPSIMLKRDVDIVKSTIDICSKDFKSVDEFVNTITSKVGITNQCLNKIKDANNSSNRLSDKAINYGLESVNDFYRKASAVDQYLKSTGLDCSAADIFSVAGGVGKYLLAQARAKYSFINDLAIKIKQLNDAYKLGEDEFNRIVNRVTTELSKTADEILSAIDSVVSAINNTITQLDDAITEELDKYSEIVRFNAKLAIAHSFPRLLKNKCINSALESIGTDTLKKAIGYKPIEVIK
jgi:hypothetical protein